MERHRGLRMRFQKLRRSIRLRLHQQWRKWWNSLAESGATNLFGQSVRVVQMQSEAGAVGAVHGAISRWIVGDNVHFLARVVIDDSYSLQIGG